MDLLPKKFDMPKMSYTDSSIHAAQYLIRASLNPSPAILLETLGYTHIAEIRSLA